MQILAGLLKFAASALAGVLLSLSAIFAGLSGSYLSRPDLGMAERSASTFPSAQLSPSAATSTRLNNHASRRRPLLPPPSTTTLQILATTTPPKPSISPDTLNAEARAAVVNILCGTASDGSPAPISGSGTIIDPRGVILTNAHVGQYFLLHDYPFPGNVQCLIRTGSPAVAAYTAELLYLPPAWIDANAAQIKSSHPIGTGEHDFSFLLITGAVDSGTSLPAVFPYIPVNDAEPSLNEDMLLASYPAGFLGGLDISRNLYISSAYAAVQKLYVFNTEDSWVDLFSIPGTVVSQGGSSGGAAVRASDGTLAGIIVTSTEATSTSGRDLRAVSMAHIEHSLASAGLGNISSLLSGDLAAKAFEFETQTAPPLTAKLISALEQ